MDMTKVIGGVDTHTDEHCAAVLDSNGRLLATSFFEATSSGYRQLVEWMEGFGDIDRVGVEGTGAYDAGLTRHLVERGVAVIDVPRPDRRTRAVRGKSDPIDAESAARSVLAGTAGVAPKGADGTIEAIRALRVARNGALKAKTAATNTLRSMIVTAPEALREQLPSTGLPNKIGEEPYCINAFVAHVTSSALGCPRSRQRGSSHPGGENRFSLTP